MRLAAAIIVSMSWAAVPCGWTVTCGVGPPTDGCDPPEPELPPEDGAGTDGPGVTAGAPPPPPPPSAGAGSTPAGGADGSAAGAPDGSAAPDDVAAWTPPFASA